MQTFGIPEYVSWYPLNDTIVVVDLRRSDSYVLNGAGALLWQRCEQFPCATGLDLAETLVHAYRIERAAAVHDSAAWAKDLLGKRLLYALPADDRPC